MSNTADNFPCMANERIRGNDVGPTGKTVGENVARIRRQSRMSLAALEEKLIDLGRRVSISGLSKIERGERRVDSDDLMALSVALDVPPVALLLPFADPTDDVTVTGAHGSASVFWSWALATTPLQAEGAREFDSRSVPYWVFPAADVSWYGDVEEKLAIGDGEAEVVRTIRYSARTAADVDWSRR